MRDTRRCGLRVVCAATDSYIRYVTSCGFQVALYAIRFMDAIGSYVLGVYMLVYVWHVSIFIVDVARVLAIRAYAGSLETFLIELSLRMVGGEQ